jgi:hypothetical protein
MVRSRVYGILAGYEDQNDHDTLRHSTPRAGRWVLRCSLPTPKSTCYRSLFWRRNCGRRPVM